MTEQKMEIPSFLKNVKECNDISVIEPNSKTLITNADKEHLVNIIKSMSPEELTIILDVIPVELAFQRIGKELERNKQFINAITQATAIMQ